MKRKITWQNFHDATRASFTSCARPKRAPDFISESGSEYWKAPKGVIRASNHWCSCIRSCDWYLDDKNSNENAVAFCAYGDFVDKLSVEYRQNQHLLRLRAIRQEFLLNPIRAAFEHSLPPRPSNPLKGAGYSRIENFPHKYLPLIPSQHKNEVASRRSGGYFLWSPVISPEALEMIYLAESGVLTAHFESRRETVYSCDDH